MIYGNNLSFDIFYIFYDNKPLNSNSYKVEESVMKPTRPNAFAATVFTCLE